MGAWGVYPFENDGAGDFESELCVDDAQNLDFLRATLLSAIETDEYLEIDAGQAVVACATVLAALNGFEPFALSPRLSTWIASHKNHPTADLMPLALQALEAVSSDADQSEIVDCWLDTPDFQAWSQSVQKIAAYLQTLSGPVP